MSLDDLKKLKAKEQQAKAQAPAQQVNEVQRSPMSKTELQKEQLLSLVAQGHKPIQAALRVGIYPSTFYSWKSKDQKFAFEIEQAMLAYRAHLLKLVQSSAEAGDWKAAKFLLERQFKDEFGEKQIVEINEAQDKKSIVIDMINQLRGIEVENKPAPIQMEEDND